MRPGLDAIVATAWTGSVLPDLLESPLDARIERLSIDLDDSELNQLPKHPAERWLSRSHTPRLWLTQCDYRVFPYLHKSAVITTCTGTSDQTDAS